MRSLLSSLALAFVFGVGSLSADVVAAEGRVLCVGGGGKTLRLRAGPGDSHRVVGALPVGACGIKVAGKCSAGWCEVQLGAAKGWADSRRVAIRERPQRATIATSATAQPSAAAKSAQPADRPTSASQPREADAVTAAPARPLAKSSRNKRPERAARRVGRSDRYAERGQRGRMRNGSLLPPMAALPEFRGPTLCVARVWPGDTLRIRTGPGTAHPEITGIHPGACGIALRGGCAGQWCPVRYRGVRGWVNASYLRRLQ